MFIFTHSSKWLKNKAVTSAITAIWLIPAFAIASIGRPSPFDPMQFIDVLNGGTGLFILMAAVSGSFVMNSLIKHPT